MKKIFLAAAALLILAAAVIAYMYLKPTEAPSQTLEAVAIATPTAAQTSAASEAAPPQPDAAGTRLFVIDPARAEARFKINEVLNGNPKNVVGTTNLVSGQILVDTTDYTRTQLGEIQIDARGLTTDSEFRNRAIKNRILLTDNFELITFKPTSITGLPAQVTVGTPFKFQITGDLTIIGKTQSVSFDAEVTPVSDNELKAFATTTVNYKDYGISIPQVQSVTSVEDKVVLEIEFTAVAK